MAETVEGLKVLFEDDNGRQVVGAGEASGLVVGLGTEASQCQQHGGAVAKVETKTKGGLFKLVEALKGNHQVVDRIESSLRLGHFMFEHHAIGVEDLKFLRELTDSTDGTNRNTLTTIAKIIATAYSFRRDALERNRELGLVDPDSVLADMLTILPAKSAAVVLMAMGDPEIALQLLQGESNSKLQGINTAVSAGMAFLLMPEANRRDILSAFPSLGNTAREAGYNFQRSLAANLASRGSPLYAFPTLQRAHGEEYLAEVARIRQEFGDWPDLVDPGRVFRDKGNGRQVR